MKWSDWGMMLFRRILAQLVDWLVGVLIILVTFTRIIPFFSVYVKNDTILGVFGVVLVIGLILTVQYPFMKNQQTVGKGFFALKVVSDEKTRPEMTVAVMLQRELLCKLVSCYFICIPVFVRKPGGHEEATRTKVVNVKKRMRRKNLG